MRRHLILAFALLAACAGGDDSTPAADRQADAADAATAYASDLTGLTPEQLEAGRLDPSWRASAEADARARAGDTATVPERAPTGPAESPRTTAGEVLADTSGAGPDQSWDDISPATVNAPAAGLPIRGDAEGPSVARLQILLDRARFRPGVIDGRWGKNTEKAIYWFQGERGLETTGEADRATMQRLEQEGGAERMVVVHTLTEEDVQGPFVSLPEDVYERAEMDCLCYESLREKLAEVFHTTPDLLQQLNPELDLDAVAAGDPLNVPNVDAFHLADLPDGKYTGGGPVERIVISAGGHYLHALDEQGRILYHFPTTLGSDYAPSPAGEFSVESITFDPTWHYQPDLLTGEDPSKEDAVLPPGPNNAVGIVWMALSEPHYGIHGTGAPATIGYATSHGCVRLTNWDAALLATNLPPGTEVSFRDVEGR